MNSDNNIIGKPSNLLQRLISNSVLTTFSLASSRLTNVIIFLMITRHLGERQAGIFAMALNYSLFFAQLAFWGLDQFLIRDINSQDDKESLSGFFLLIRLSATTICFIVYIVLILFIQKNPAHLLHVLLVGGLNIYTESIQRFFFAIYNAFEESKYIVITSLVGNIIKIMILILLMYVNFINVLWFLIAITISNTISLLISFYYIYQNIVVFKFKKKIYFYEYYKRSSIIFIIISIANTFELQIDTILLTQFIADRTRVTLNIGIYNAITVILFALMIITNGLRATILPSLSKLYQLSSIQAINLFILIHKNIFAIVVPISLTITYYSHNIIKILYGNKFNGSIIGLQIIIWTFVFSMISIPNILLLVIIKKNKLLFFIQIIATFTNIVLNILLIPKIEFMGSVYARVFSSAVPWIISSLYIAHFMSIKILDSDILKIIFINIITFFIFYIMNMASIYWIFGIFIGLISNFLLLCMNNIIKNRCNYKLLFNNIFTYIRSKKLQ